MKLRLGRCNNLEFCQLATQQKLIELPEDEPFICPRCSSDLVPAGEKRQGGNRGALLALQAVVLVGGGGLLAWKLLLHPPKNEQQAFAPHATPAELALSASPDAPVEAPAPAEPAVAARPAGAAPLPAATVLLRLAGPDTLTAHMARRLAAGYLALIGDTDIETVPTPDQATVEVTGLQAGAREAIAITTVPSERGFSLLAANGTDMAMTLRQPSEAELKALPAIAEPGGERVIGVDAVRVIVGAGNKVAAISRAQLAGVLSGRVTDWASLGVDTHGPIHAYAPDPASSDGAVGLIGPASAVISLPDEASVAAMVGRDPLALGFVGLAQATTSRAVPVSDGAGRPVAPTDLAVASEEYPLSRRLYLYGAPSGQNTFVRRFGDYAASAAGQAVVQAAGFVSLSVTSAPAPATPAPGAAVTAAVDPLAAFIGSATRLSTVFRFKAGSDALDSRAERDVQRLAAFLRARNSDGGHLLLAGFADTIGGTAVNAAMAQKRAETVAAALTRLGLAPGRVAAFGDAYPVADNATSDGREKNRRVEVYLRP